MPSVANLTFGTVIGRYTASGPDTTGDADYEPEALPLTGTIEFVPNAGSLVVNTGDAGAGGYTAFVLRTLTATLDPQGYITFGGNQGIVLTATDDPAATPNGWTYTAKFHLKDVFGAAVTIPDLPFQVPGGSTLSLPSLAPVTANAGTVTIQGAQGPKGTGLQIDGVVATSTALPAAGGYTGKFYLAQDTFHAYWSNGTTWIDLGSLQGPTGPIGPTPTLSVVTNTLAAGSPATATVGGTPEAPVLTLGIPQGAQGSTTGLSIDDSAASAVNPWSGQKIKAYVDQLLAGTQAYVETTLTKSGLVTVPNLIVYIMQNTDGTWPLRGVLPNGVKAVWMGLDFPPTTAGYALAGDGYRYLDINA